MATALIWLRRDLRLADNPAMIAASQHRHCIPVYVHNPADEGDWAPGAASRWWLHHSLKALSASLDKAGSRLIIRSTHDTLDCLRAIISETGAEALYWNRVYEPGLIKRDQTIKLALREDGLAVHSLNAALLREPWEVTRRDGGHYRAFTPFWRALSAMPPIAPEPAPELPAPPPAWPKGQPVESLGLLPGIPWDRHFHDQWRPGEAGANAALETFLESALQGYDDARDRPGQAGTSRLSPHLHWGEISPRQIRAAVTRQQQETVLPDHDVESFLSEVGWREFAHHLLYHFPHMPQDPLDARFRHFPWAADTADALRAWERGRTGIPIVDAGMRELWAIGWMHNRVRMIVGSLLTKNLRIPWQTGEAWFWDTLVDADLASNSMGWQWIQGCGADAAPYFRIFNPVRQGERFDPEGHYVRRWVPELRALPDKYLHSPWSAPEQVLREAGVRLGDTYPRPLVDLATSRKDALAAYQDIRS